MAPEAFFGFQNFVVWEMRTKCALMVQDAWDVVSRDEVEPDAVSNPDAAKQFQRDNARALLIIWETVLPEHMHILRRTETAKEAWDRLCDAYSRWALENSRKLQRKLFRLRMRKGQKMHDYMCIFHKCLNHASVHRQFSERKKMMLFLDSLPDSYEGMVVSIRCQIWEKPESATLSSVIGNALSYSRTLEERSRARR